MARKTPPLDAHLEALDQALLSLRRRAGAAGMMIDRWRGDAAAMRFALQPAGRHPILLAILGGTGTGKSTLVNRLLDANLSATSFRRTFTAGAVAMTADPGNIPPGWLGIEHVIAAEQELPVRGRADALVIVPVGRSEERRETGEENGPRPSIISDLNASLIDTPDLDGDQPAHHAQADRVFRWAQAVLFLVTPEKYQMTELLPYYRLAGRYALPSLYVMNKAEQQAQVDDYAEQLAIGPSEQERVFAIPRDDAAYEPPADANLQALRSALQALQPPDAASRERGIANRTADLLGRLHDQILSPLRTARREADRMIAALRALETPAAGVDVNPLTLQLQRRLQQRSVLYLMGPRRMLDRVRQVPGMLARLPRTTWDLVVRGDIPAGVPEPEQPPETDRKLPDFRVALVDQFAILQSRIDDVLRSNAIGETWLEGNDSDYGSTHLPADDAGRIADEELADLKQWLEQRWNATPRDTMLLQRLLKHLPGGRKLTQWSEAAPYLLVIVSAMNNAFFGPIDLAVFGGYSLATWITEKLSNEVASRTRRTNRRIADRFAALAHDQINRTCDWLTRQAPTAAELDHLQRLSEQLA